MNLRVQCKYASTLFQTLTKKTAQQNLVKGYVKSDALAICDDYVEVILLITPTGRPATR